MIIHPEALGSQAPGEPRDVVVGVERAGRREDEASELALDGGDGRGQRVPAWICVSGST